MWTEPDGVDYALSFQEPEGCAEVWNFIQEVQRHMSTFGKFSQDYFASFARSRRRPRHVFFPDWKTLDGLQKSAIVDRRC